MDHQFKTKLICLPSGSTMKQARDLMNERRIRHLPIVDKDNKIISMLSKHDLSDVTKFQDMPVDFFATTPVSYVDASEGVKAVALKMLQENISCVLIADSEKNVIGIATTHDLLYHLVTLLNAQEKDSQPIAGSDALITIGEFFRKLSDIGI